MRTYTLEQGCHTTHVVEDGMGVAISIRVTVRNTESFLNLSADALVTNMSKNRRVVVCKLGVHVSDRLKMYSSHY